MSMDELCLKVNREEVAAKVMDGEAILINISNGLYYSMDNIGGEIWQMIERGHSLRQIASNIADRFEVTPDNAQADIERLANELLQENLVTKSSEPAPRLDAVSATGKESYEPPSLNVYRDMSDLLAIDPPMPGLEEVPWQDAQT